jgi:hypothetical protein
VALTTTWSTKATIWFAGSKQDKTRNSGRGLGSCGFNLARLPAAGAFG